MPVTFDVHNHNYSISVGAKGLNSLAEKNRKIGELWRGLSMEDKGKYYTLAKEESSSSVGHIGDWKTVSRVLSNMNENVSIE